MIRTNLRKAAILASILAGSAIALSLGATPPSINYSSFPLAWGSPSQLDFTQTVKLGKLTRVADKEGDVVTVMSVRGPSSKIAEGNTYEVSGTYRLVSANSGTISAGISECACDNSIEPGMIARIARGEGQFKLYIHDCRGGSPHVFLQTLPGPGRELWLYFQTELPPQLPACCADSKPSAHVFGDKYSGSR